MTNRSQKIMFTKFHWAILIFAVVATAMLAISVASDTFGPQVESEAASIEAPATIVDDPGASKQRYVEFKEETVDPGDTFTFAAAGDFGFGNSARAIFESVGQGDFDFMLAVGDFGYDVKGTEEDWCRIVKARVGNNFPFQLLVGNHDTGQGTEADLKEYVKCLPNRMPNMTGEYGVQYYFDHIDLARFIFVSPRIKNYGGAYDKGTQRYEWTKNAIEDAKAQGIPWIFLSMHHNCITIGTKKCQMSPDLFNLALETGVDVMLQGHEHAYFRTKQLALSQNCPGIEPDAYNKDCVSNTGSEFTKGDGMVLVITGAGGRGLRSVNLQDSEIGYFEIWNGSNSDKKSHGYNRFVVSEDEITSEFIKVNGSFEDTFSITVPKQRN